MNPVKHRTYFMPDFFYQIPKFKAAKEEPYNTLDENEWRKVMHHLWAHSVEGETNSPERMTGILREVLLDYLQHTKNTYSEGETLTWVARMYLEQSGEYVDIARPNPIGLFSPENTDLPNEEHELFGKVSKLYVKLRDEHPEVRGFV